MNPPSVTAVIPAYNEEKTLGEAVAATETALKKDAGDYEIIVVDDGSIDATGRIANEIAHKNNRVRVFHNNPNKNIGYNMRLAVGNAGKEYCFLFIDADTYPGSETFHNLLAAIGKKDFVLGFLEGYGDRHWTRRFISWLFVRLMNGLFWFRVPYYNGPLIVKTAVWRTVPMTTDSFAYMAEVVVTLVKRGLTYTVVPVRRSPERKGVNLAMLKRNTGSVLKAVLALFWRVNVQKKLYA
ncbi:MAG: hypothetical protein A2946_02160 [Candidatus Liptonbacteria bacterium RIFCSPLOWO2_01_FULL_53_13]|uniref:Glycosyltransferase 2-like domain-containing protein n=1 Tax=Candidatus Liptonbacteria bacterium RIFCSPLOWO2_01_FULL_53_13 TaxID=1798651 RepID=A0A1G2CKA9_9BACT|nr:MAG: hypothetical protein A2946_02160 [Candidatus Liptonbacteria bacterium RIFCSPLOWO2_01_FULL_53_13]